MKSEEKGIWTDVLVMIALVIILTLPFVSESKAGVDKSQARGIHGRNADTTKVFVELRSATTWHQRTGQ